MQTKPLLSKEELKTLDDKYDYYVCGSDQIWNPNFLNPVYMFDYISDHNSKVAYAASLGVTSWPKDKIEPATTLMRKFKAISLREKKSIALIQDMTGRNDVQYVSDPVNLLEKKEWDKVADDHRLEITELLNTPYIFCYMLHKNKRQIELMNRYCRNTGLKLVTVSHPDGNYHKLDIGFGDIDLKAISPQDFLALIRNAKIIFTDSFHCVMFSLIFEKNFYCFTRSDYAEMNIRIEDILSLTNLENHLMTDKISEAEIDSIPTPDYNLVNQRLSEHRCSSINWLKEVLHIKEE